LARRVGMSPFYASSARATSVSQGRSRPTVLTAFLIF
jgi:hypothetical protein